MRLQFSARIGDLLLPYIPQSRYGAHLTFYSKRIGSCSAYGRGERFLQDFGRKNLRERDYLEDSDVDGRITLRWIFRKWGVGA